ncbi:MAG: dTDP-4-dehydrorhamnose 3,5-epimerase [Planctomycetaceae bacterium]|nr:dTDP-4-dehydrorhamnose 3,5-epimerase [Planctomycetaceae bacterium]
MLVNESSLPGVLIIEPKVFGDSRGFFFEAWQAERYCEQGVVGTFVQDNISRSSRGVLRGLHYQWPRPQGKLVFVLEGEVLDVAVDVRLGSPNFGQATSVVISGDNKRQVWIPPGFAHGFAVKSETALFVYKCTDLYFPEYERGVAWNDPALAIDWSVTRPLLSAKDARLTSLADVPRELLPKLS